MSECFFMALLSFKRLFKKDLTSDTHSNLETEDMYYNYFDLVSVACSELEFTLQKILQNQISTFGESVAALAVMSTETSPVMFAGDRCCYVA